MDTAVLTFALCILPFNVAEGAPVHETLFQEGQEAYRQGNFQKAAESFQEIVRSGFKSGEIYYNMGNCYFKLGQMGRAILFYERANRLLKRDRETKSNLELARSMLKDKYAAAQGRILIPLLRWMANLFNLWELTLLNVVLGWMLLMGISLLLLAFKKGSWARSVILLLFLLQAYTFLSWYIQYRDVTRLEGIVLDEEVEVHSGAGENFPESFKIHEGTKVSILSVLGDWAKISLQNGLTGWMKSKAYERI